MRDGGRRARSGPDSSPGGSTDIGLAPPAGLSQLSLATSLSGPDRPAPRCCADILKIGALL
jgi:hypothetical protein